MPPPYRDDTPDDLDDREYPDADPWEDDSTDTRECPACGADVYEDADQCPVCGEFLMPDTHVWSDKPTWWIVLGILGIITLVAALIIGF